MTSIAGSLSPTRIIGLTANFFALVACAIAWVRGGGVWHRRRVAAVFAALESALLMDMVFNWRWRLHDLLAHVAIARNLYGDRSGPQLVALGLVGSVVAAGIGLALLLFRGRPGASLAAFGGILSLSCWGVEVISLHSVDSLLYLRVDGVTLVRLAGALCSLITGVGILWDTLSMPAKLRSVSPAEAPATSPASS